MRLLTLFVLFGISFAAFSQDEVLKIEPLEAEMYGSSCGIVGTDPALRTTIEYLIEQADVKTIDAWLYSDRATRKVYAVEALIRLREEGLELSDIQVEGIRRTKQMDDIITTCSGCLMGEVTVKEALRQYDL